jgi:hypothetical protein
MHKKKNKVLSRDDYWNTEEKKKKKNRAGFVNKNDILVFLFRFLAIADYIL